MIRLAVALAALLAAAPAAADPGAMLRRAAGSSVRISNRLHMGSGVVVAPGVVLTCAHVTDGQKIQIVLDDAGRVYDGELTRWDADRDLALISVPALFARPAPLAAADPERYEQLWMLASPLGKMNVAAPEMYIGPQSGRPHRWLLSGWTQHGASGGAVLNARGELECLVETTYWDVGALLGECVARPDVAAFLAGK